MKLFVDQKTYTPQQRSEITGEPLRTITQKRWRGDDAKYLKLGSRVYYPGSALNEYFAEKLVDPSRRVIMREISSARRRAEQVQHLQRKTAGRKTTPPTSAA